MKTFINQARQGDVFIKRVKALPDGVNPKLAEHGKFIIAHSETGHHHVVEEIEGCEIFETEDPLTLYMRIIKSTEVVLEHLRSFDIHESIQFTPGIYRFRIGRERTPEGWRRVAD